MGTESGIKHKDGGGQVDLASNITLLKETAESFDTNATAFTDLGGQKLHQDEQYCAERAE